MTEYSEVTKIPICICSSKIEKIQKHRKSMENKKAYCVAEEQRYSDYETKLKKILERRKDLLLEVM